MSEDTYEIDGEVIEMHRDAKYVVVVPEDRNFDMEHMARTFEKWWESDLPMIFVSGVRLVRVDEEE